ncbi:CDK5 regulatory subunit-associated protein 3-like [Branchiostoma floridae]|uniref:CDK5 regulatory subunit-associated protein 3-like n=1 Tax=Branchiostoma floridae TaxID=7739 RepID=A0A9J7M609_BRAFL|nr:CDK5 regulatory subunit-associated protein 3-like [Branchiostoma floridae]XP_035695007.1 CDK5 regulatory subunit-associated protein 3-like [Branchiostoma floridae]
MVSQQDIQKLPIDIHYNKLLDWLVDRRHCNRQWQAAALVVREKINAAIQDMPEVQEITQLLQGTYINYFHCMRIVELLKVSEANTKDIFGRYSSQRMKDWQEVVKLYEKDNVNLAEGAQLLTRNVNYEIPAVKRQIAKYKQTQEECVKKEADFTSQARIEREGFKASCKELGIVGKNIRSELLALLKQLPGIHQKLAEETKSLQPAIDFYSAFVHFLLSSSGDGSKTDVSMVPMLRYLTSHGNTTVYQWRTGEVPTVVVEPGLPGAGEPVATEEPQISWEDSGEAAGGDGEISWGDDGGEGQEEGGEIDWGGMDTGGAEDAGIDWGGDADLDITVEGSGADQSQNGASAVADSRVAMGTDALSLFDNKETRDQVINELRELSGFLAQRLVEMEGENNVVAETIFQSAPQELQMRSVEEITDMVAPVDTILAQLTNNRMRQLYMLKASPKYVDRLTANLQQKLDQADKMLARKRIMIEKRQEALQDQRQTEPKLQVIIKKTKELKKQMEGEISKRYSDRPVNIMGEINLL